MQRRHFLQNSVNLALGSFLTAPFFIPTSSKFKGKVIVVGAGAAGLYAANLLQERGCEVLMLEANQTFGGRIRQNTDFATAPIDLGAQWIHGKNELYRLAKSSRTPLYQDNIEQFVRFRWRDALQKGFPTEVSTLMAALRQKNAQFPDVSLLDYLQSQNYPAEILELAEFMSTDAATQTAHLSLREAAKLVHKFSHGVDFQLQNSTLFQFIQAALPEALRACIRCDTQILQVDHSRTGVKLYDQKGKVYEADKVLLTVPISILQQNKIHFTPELPSEKRANFQAIGMDKGLKMFIKFSQPFYPFGVVNGKNAGYYIDATKNGFVPRQGLLTSLVMGKKAEAYYDNPEKMQHAVLQELDGYYAGQASKYVEGFLFQDWGHEPFIEGVYSYAKPGMGTQRLIAQLPLGNKVFFAGEAFNDAGNNGTVHGAIQTAAHAVRQMMIGI